MAENIYAKLALCRQEFLRADLKKTGVNPHAEFEYLELADFLPTASRILAEHGLVYLVSFRDEQVVGTLVNTENSEEQIEFTVPYRCIAEPAKFRMNEVQSCGAEITYYRRYLWFIVMDCVDPDALDRTSGKTESAPAVPVAEPAKKTKKKSAPQPTPAERSEIKKEVVGADEPADELQIAGLKAALKELMTKDPSKEEFVQAAAVKTKAFTTLTRAKCDELIAGVRQMLAQYGDANG